MKVDMQNYYKVNKNFFQHDVLSVAKNFIGSIVKYNSKNGLMMFKVTEIESYLGEHDKGSHTYQNRRTKRTEPMFLSGGHLYVYFIYGMYYNLNFVADKKDIPAGILLRGIKILEGHNIASLNRYKKPYDRLNNRELKNLSNGPGKVCQVLQITTEQTGSKFNDLFEIYAPYINHYYTATPRIGIDYAEEDALLPYRFIIE